MIEAELTMHVREPEHVRELLAQRATGETSTYRDVYFDAPDGSLTAEDRELRVRVIETEGDTTAIMTVKGAPVHESRSKPEYETIISDPEQAKNMLRALGYVEYVSLTKHCRNHAFTVGDRELLATLVAVPELDGTFLELETVVPRVEMDAAFDVLWSVIGELGITKNDETTESYTSAVRRARG